VTKQVEKLEERKQGFFSKIKKKKFSFLFVKKIDDGNLIER
jgi:hypothetical protein